MRSTCGQELNSDCLLSFWPLWMSKQGDVIDQLGRVVKLFTHPQKPFVFLFFPIICLASWDIAKQAFSIYLLMYIPPICYFRGQSMNTYRHQKHKTLFLPPHILDTTFLGSQIDQCFQKKNSGCRLTGRIQLIYASQAG